MVSNIEELDITVRFNLWLFEKGIRKKCPNGNCNSKFNLEWHGGRTYANCYSCGFGYSWSGIRFISKGKDHFGNPTEKIIGW